MRVNRWEDFSLILTSKDVQKMPVWEKLVRSWCFKALDENKKLSHLEPKQSLRHFATRMLLTLFPSSQEPLTTCRDLARLLCHRENWAKKAKDQRTMTSAQLRYLSNKVHPPMFMAFSLKFSGSLQFLLLLQVTTIGRLKTSYLLYLQSNTI
jgi:hypothetical protein